MLPSPSTPHQEITPSLRTAFVYLLVSRQHPGAFKLGVTKHPATRFNALTKRFGAFDLQASLLVTAASWRAALDLEGVLRAVFDAPAWRVKPPLPPTRNSRPQPSDGDNEWYRLSALEPMVGLLSGMIERDLACAFHRFDLVRGLQDSDLWQKHLRHAGVQTRFCPPNDVELDAKKRLERSESNFGVVQAWMQRRRHQLVSATPFAYDNQGNRRRTFVYRTEDVPVRASDDINAGSGEDLAAACIVSYRTAHGYTSFTYLGSVSVPATDLSTYSVEFVVAPQFAQASEACPPLRALLTRIVNWLDAPALPA